MSYPRLTQVFVVVAVVLDDEHDANLCITNHRAVRVACLAVLLVCWSLEPSSFKSLVCSVSLCVLLSLISSKALKTVTLTRKLSVEAGIRRNAISYTTWNEIETLEIQTCICTAAILSAISEFVFRFVSNFCNWCPVSLRTIQWTNEVSILINCWVIAKYRVSRPPFCPPFWNL